MKWRICNTNQKKSLITLQDGRAKYTHLQVHFLPTYVSFIICFCITNEFKFKVPQRMGKFSLGSWKVCMEKKKAQTEG